MARIRTIKPDFWDSADTAQADLRTRLLYIAMWNWADDYGIGDGHPGRIINFAFPSDEIAAADYPRLLADVSSAFGVVFFEHLGRPYYTVPAWDKHQRTEKKAKPKDGLLEAAAEAVELANTAPQAPNAESPRNVADSPTQGGEPSDAGSRKSEGEREVEKELAPQAPPTTKTKPRKRIPNDYMPEHHVVTKARAEFPTVTDEQLKSVHEDFVLYWQGQGKPMADWDATWLRWIRRELPKFARSTHAPPSGNVHKLRGLAELTAETRAAEQAETRKELA